MITVLGMLNVATGQQLFVGNPCTIRVSRASSSGLRFFVNAVLLPENEAKYLEGVFVNDQCTLDIGEYLISFVGFDKPTLPAGNPTFANSQKKRFTVNFGVKDNTGATVDTGNNATVFQAMLGAMYAEQWAGFGQTLPVLTYQPKNKKLVLGQLDYEFLYLSGNGSSVAVNVTVSHFAGPNTVYSQNVTLEDTENRTTIMPLAWLLASVDLSSAWRVSVQVVDAVAGASQKFTYDLDKIFRKQTRFFVFQNSLGGADTVAFTGERSSISEAEAKMYEQTLPHNYNKGSARSKKMSVAFEQNFKIETGFKTREELLYLGRELLQSENVYEVLVGEDNVPYLRAVVIITKKIEFEQDTVAPQSVGIEYKYAL